MASFHYNIPTQSIFIFVILYLPSACSIYFQISHFDSIMDDIIYHGDASPSNGIIELNKLNYSSVGRATYAQKVLLWDSSSGRLTDFATHFSVTFNTQGYLNHGHGLAFFLAPVGNDIPSNSSGGFLGLFNITTKDPFHNQIVSVEFDSFPNLEWDPPIEHVGINNRSLASSVYTPWNTSLHNGEKTDVWITYNAMTKNLSVSWTYLSKSQENVSLFYQIDLMKVLPEWVSIGFSAATGDNIERHTLEFWEFSSNLESKEKNGGNVMYITLAALVTILVVVLLVALVIGFTFFLRKMQKIGEKIKPFNLNSINNYLEKGAGPGRFSYDYLAVATNNFSNEKKLGEGGFGTVYKGYLTGINMSIAVKRISRGSKQGKREYITEVKIISRMRHKNLVKLIGWCHDRGEFLMVYEFMPNGSLDFHLFGKRPPLPWTTRYEISIGLASALLYLHEEWEKCVVHRDIKSSNVMLDSDFNVKLGDFGLARLLDHELNNSQATGLAGTCGYMAPEYISTGRASKESDVFSYGVVALEIVTGRKSNNPAEMDSKMGLVEWVWDLFGKGEILQAVDEKMQKDFDQKQVECLVVVGLWCAHPYRSWRPSIRQAIHVLCFQAALPILPPKMPVPKFQVASRQYALVDV